MGSPMSKHVAVIGAGIAGLTAAHELAARGYTVDVYEERNASPKRSIGGKARSQRFNANGRSFWGEHGYRFFPSFYKLVPDTMERIPLDADQHDVNAALQPAAASVRSNLRHAPEAAVAREGTLGVFPYTRGLARNFDDVASLARLFFEGLALPPDDVVHIGARLIRYWLSGDKRRLGQFERMTFFDLVDADRLGTRARHALESTPKALVAMNSSEGNARTLGNVLFLMLSDQLRNDPLDTDRLLAGPTTPMWIEPWRNWLRRLGVRFHLGSAAAGFSWDPGARRIDALELADGRRVRADWYIAAVPMERMHGLVSDPMAQNCPALARLRTIDLEKTLGWMVGAQFYLRRDVPVVNGHVAYPDSDWAITSISQAQFWSPEGNFRSTHGSDIAGGLLSVDICDWQGRRGRRSNKVARECTREEIFADLVAQIGAVRTASGEPILADDNIVAWHLDEDIEFSGDRIVTNHSRLLIHPPGFWESRPEPTTGIDNLMLTGDYVRNALDLATMEGANATARVAVNAILDRNSSAQPRCMVVDDYLRAAEPPWLRVVKSFDDQLFDAGLDPGAILESPVVTWLAEALPGDDDTVLRAIEERIRSTINTLLQG